MRGSALPAPDRVPAVTGCASRSLVDVPTFDLGFDLAASRLAGKTIGVRTDSSAYAAGLRNGQILTGRISVTNNDPQRTALFGIRDDAGDREVHFFPVGRPAQAWQYQIGDCGNGTTTSNGAEGIDDSQLFDDPGFIDAGKGGSAAALRSRLSGLTGSTAAAAGNRGWLTSKVLQCPRLAVLPVIDLGSVVGGIGGRNITGFSYVWIDDDGTTSDRGLHWTGDRVDSMRGFVVDPGYLPAVVAGSKRVGSFLGENMPKQVLLIPDLGSAAT
jgi:hypothetical protein